MAWRPSCRALHRNRRFPLQGAAVSGITWLLSKARSPVVAHIVISSIGTMGDFVPFVPLAKALKARGHQVRLAVNEAMAYLFRQAGLDVVACGPRFGPEEARRVAVA